MLRSRRQTEPRTVGRIRSGGWVALLALVGTGCGGGNVPLPDLTGAMVGDTAGLVERGEYLVRDAAVCGHCHAADPQRDPGR